MMPGAPSLIRLYRFKGGGAPFPCRPDRLDLDCSFHSRRVMAKTRPRPVYRLRREATLDRIQVHVAQLLKGLLRISHIKVVISSLPKLLLIWRLQCLRRSLFQHLQSGRQRRVLWFSDEQMYMLRHQHVTCNDKLVVTSNSFRFVFEGRVSTSPRQQWKAVIATERNEVKTAGSLKSNETCWHERTSVILMRRLWYPTLATQGWGTRLMADG